MPTPSIPTTVNSSTPYAGLAPAPGNGLTTGDGAVLLGTNTLGLGADILAGAAVTEVDVVAAGGSGALVALVNVTVGTSDTLVVKVVVLLVTPGREEP